MAAPMKFNVYVGSETGLLKALHVQNNHWDNLNTISTADKAKEIVSIDWTHDTDAELCIGLKNQCVLEYDTQSGQFSHEITFDAGKGKLRNVSKLGEQYVTSVDSGPVKCWKEGEEYRKWEAGENLYFHHHNAANWHQFVTGGKENELKLWNIEKEDVPIFTAKNVKNDWLNLRVPVWVLGARFIPNSERIITCTGHHQIRIYDPKAQRRPVLDMTFDEYPITAMSLCPQRDNLIVVGNTHGKMGTVDIRKGRMVNLFKGIAGGIRDVQCHKSRPIVVSCGLDRFLRVHDLNTKALLHKFYLKSRLNCIALTDVWDSEDSTELENVQSEETDSVEIKTEPVSDELWDQFEVVSTKTKRKHESVIEDVKVISKKQRKAKNSKNDNSVKNREEKIVKKRQTVSKQRTSGDKLKKSKTKQSKVKSL